jgi:hypothetical protein
MKKLFLMALVALMSLQCAAQITFVNEVNSKNHFEYWTNRRYLRLVGDSSIPEGFENRPENQSYLAGDTTWFIVASLTTNRFDSSPILYLGNNLQTALSSLTSIYMWSQNAELEAMVTIKDFLNQEHTMRVTNVLGVRTVYIDSPKTAGVWSLTPKCFDDTIDRIKDLITKKNFDQK